MVEISWVEVEQDGGSAAGCKSAAGATTGVSFVGKRLAGRERGGGRRGTVAAAEATAKVGGRRRSYQSFFSEKGRQSCFRKPLDRDIAMQTRGYFAKYSMHYVHIGPSRSNIFHNGPCILQINPSNEIAVVPPSRRRR
jgi:hypothetical protein